MITKLMKPTRLTNIFYYFITAHIQLLFLGSCVVFNFLFI